MTLREIGAAVLDRPQPDLADTQAEGSLVEPQGTPPPQPSSRQKRSWTTAYVMVLVVADLVLAFATLLVCHKVISVSAGAPLTWVAATAFAWPLAVGASNGYSRSQIGVGNSDIGAILKAMLYLIVAGAVAFAIGHVEGIVGLVVVAAPVMCGLALVTRLAARKVVHARQRKGSLLREVIVVGTLGGVQNLSAVLEREPHCGLRGVGVCVPPEDVEAARALGMNVVGDADHVASAVAAVDCDGVAVTAGQQPDFLRRLAWSLEGLDVDLLVHPGLVEISGPRMHLRPYVGLPLLRIEHPHFAGWRRVVKRVTDVVLTSFGLLIAAPFMMVVAALIKFGDGGPVFFTQRRVGLDGRTFTMFKFRSMVVDAEARLKELEDQNEGAGGVLFKIQHDPRVTRVGRFLRKYSMDELPQLFNVLLGDMSLVGPRPPLPKEVDAYSTDVNRRLLVQPGLTGLWQVSGRSLLSWEESVRLDLRYVENWCLSLDLLLLWKTVWAVLAKRGAF